jgi:peroxiredoxin
MGKWLMRLGLLTVLVAMLVATGCPTEESAKPPTPPPVTVAPPTVVQDDPTEKEPREPEPIAVPETLEKLDPEATEIPEVKLTETQRKTCVVWLGDLPPEGELPNLDGQTIALDSLLGEKATVAFVWTAGASELAQKTACAALADLQADALDAYGDKGLSVLAINENDSAEKVKELLGTVDVTYPVLLDTDGGYFAKVATADLPRVYVLDAEGKIVWLDIGFSETTRRELKQTLEFMLGEPKSAEK